MSAQHVNESKEKSILVKAQGKKLSTYSRGAIKKVVKVVLSPIDSSPERISRTSIRRQERRAFRDPKYASNRLISTLANTDPEDLFPSGAAGDLLDDDLQSEAGPLVSPTPSARSSRSFRKQRWRPKLLKESSAAEGSAGSSANESGPSIQRNRETVRRTTRADEINTSSGNIEDDREAMQRVSREIYDGVERLGAVKVNEYVIPCTRKATILVGRVLRRMEQLETENRELRRALEGLNYIKEAVRDIQQREGPSGC